MHRRFTLLKDGYIRCDEIEGEGVSYAWEGPHPPFHIKFDPYFAAINTEGCFIPPWYYGLTRDEDFGRLRIFHIIPFNLIVRAARYLEFAWARLRCRRSYFDVQLLAAEARGFERGQEYQRLFPSK